MTTSKNCFGAGGGLLGGFGIHLPDHDSQAPHPGGFGGGQGGHQSGQFGGAEHHAGKGLGISNPVQFDFSDYVPGSTGHALDHAFNVLEIPLPGGVTISPVALVAFSCLAIVLTSSLVKSVAVRCLSG